MRGQEDQDLEVSSIIFFAAIHRSGRTSYGGKIYAGTNWRACNGIFWYRLVAENADRGSYLARILDNYKTPCSKEVQSGIHGLRNGSRRQKTDFTSLHKQGNPT
jgi:hypothetical protein